MMHLNIWTLLTLQVFTISQCSSNQCVNVEINSNDIFDGNPLILTPFIENGKIDDGKRLARVPFTEKLNITSYSGFFTVNKTYDSNMFFWYFQSTSLNKEAPVVVWLEGGPGTPCIFSIFTVNGPLTTKNGEICTKEIHWAQDYHMIYVDSPVGTGLSFMNDSRGYSSDQTQVGDNLYTALSQFFQLFPELQNNKFFVAGESYGGKFVPALGHAIHEKNQIAKTKINLQGLAIGNGFSDPIHQIVYCAYFYQIGLIDDNQSKECEEYETKVIDLIKTEQWDEAMDVLDDLVLNDGLNSGKSFFQNTTGFKAYFNILHEDIYFDHSKYLIMNGSSYLRNNIHVGNVTWHGEDEIKQHLRLDILKSITPWICELLDNNYPILVYTGQLDLIVPYTSVVNYLSKLKCSTVNNYKDSKRYTWKVDGELAGYVKYWNSLTELMVRNSGHSVPLDKPKWGLKMMNIFTSHEKFSTDTEQD